MLLEWTMQINCRPARLAILNLSKMNKVKGKKERKRRWTLLKKFILFFYPTARRLPLFFLYTEHSSPFLFLGYYMVSAAAVGRFSLSSSNVFSFWVNLLLLLFITPQMNQKLFQGRTYISIWIQYHRKFINYKKRYKLMMLMKLMISHVVESDDGAHTHSTTFTFFRSFTFFFL